MEERRKVERKQKFEGRRRSGHGRRLRVETKKWHKGNKEVKKKDEGRNK